MDHILLSDSQQTLDELFQNQARLLLRQISVPLLKKATDISAIAELHDQVEVCCRFCSCYETYYVFVLYFGHDRYFIYEEFVILAPNFLLVNDLYSVVLIWIVL